MCKLKRERSIEKLISGGVKTTDKTEQDATCNRDTVDVKENKLCTRQKVTCCSGIDRNKEWQEIKAANSLDTTLAGGGPKRDGLSCKEYTKRLKERDCNGLHL